MNDQEIRILIADACGWIKKQHPDKQHEEIWERETPLTQEYKYYPPDYPNDLNAMHEAEKRLNKDQRVAFIHLLLQIDDYTWTCVHSTASQRAEAFLRAIGKWKNT